MSDTDLRRNALHDEIFESPAGVKQLGRLFEEEFRRIFEAIREDDEIDAPSTPAENSLKLRTDLILGMGKFLKLDRDAIEKDLKAADDAYTNNGGEA